MRNVRVIIVVIMFLGLAQFCMGEVLTVPLVCVNCGKKFEGVQASVIVYNAGVDSDFCTYSTSGSSRAFEIQTCPYCGYSSSTSNALAQKPLSENEKAKIQSVLELHWKGRKFRNQEEIPIALKFLLAVEIMKANKEKPVDIGRVAHLGSWAIRDKITFRAVKKEFKTPTVAFQAYDRLKKLSISSPSDFSKAFELLQLTVRLGLPASRNKLLESIVSAAPKYFGVEDVKTLSTQLRSFQADMKDEAYFMTVAADLFEKSIANNVAMDDKEKENISYLIGELRRRCGHQLRAKKWFSKTLKTAKRADIKSLIPLLLKHCESAAVIKTGLFPEITCPLCGKKTQYLRYSQPDYLGGKDTDFATYSLDPSTYSTEVICCLNCLYSNYRKSFPNQLTDIQKVALNKELSGLRSRIKATSPQGFKAWERFELVAHCYLAMGKGRDKVGMVFLNSAWSARRALCSPTMELDLPDEPLLPNTGKELAKKVDDGTFDGYYVAALICHRAGLTKQRDSYLKKAKKMTLDDPAREALVRSARSIVKTEERFLREVIEQFEKMSPDIPFFQMYNFIRGDAYRRLGKKRKAKSIFKDCIGLPQVGEISKKLYEQM